MDPQREAATISALEAATQALLVALETHPEPDLDAAADALEARATAIGLLATGDPAQRPPEINARLVAVLEHDARAMRRIQDEMAVTRERLAELVKARAAASAYGASGHQNAAAAYDAGAGTPPAGHPRSGVDR